MTIEGMMKALSTSEERHAKAFVEWARTKESITGLSLSHEMVVIPPVSGWKRYKPGKRWLYRIEFGNGYQDMFHVNDEGERLSEYPAWYFDHHGITPLKL